MIIAEVKRNPKKIDIKLLEKKASKLMAKYKKYDYKFQGYSLEDIKHENI